VPKDYQPAQTGGLDQLGLLPGCPVVAGGLDAATGALGAGVLDAGQVQEQGGQAGGMSICTEKPFSHRNLILGFHVLPGKWLVQGGTVGGGSLVWWQNIMGTDTNGSNKHYSFEAMSNEAAHEQPGANGLVFLPYMAGERSPIWDPQARGVFIGLSYEKTRGAIVRALMEGNAYALRHNMETAEAMGIEVEQLRAVGGAAQSRVWTQIKADVTGKDVVVMSDAEHATAKGAAVLAGIGAGIYSTDSSSLKGLFRESTRYSPRPETKELYDRQYGVYVRLYQRIKDEFPILNQCEQGS
jgi:xylulokinase